MLPSTKHRSEKILYGQRQQVFHIPAGLWSPESEEDMDMEQRRLLAALEPCNMLGWKPTCRRACLVKWSLLMKHFSHSGQLKRFSPVCVRQWRVSSSDRENFLLHSGQVHLKGRSPKKTKTYFIYTHCFKSNLVSSFLVE